MKTEKFKVVDFIRMFIKSLNKYLKEFPNSEREIKWRIKNTSYEMLELAYQANSSDVINEKISIMNKVLAKAKLIDFLLDMATEEGYITVKKYTKMADRLCDIEKYARGWQDSVKKGNIQIDNRRQYIKVENTKTEDNKNQNKPSNSKKKTDNINESEQISIWM